MEVFKPNLDEYNSLYDAYPDTQEELVEYLLNTYKVNQSKLDAEIERINSIKWKEADIVFYIVPKGTPRPRNGGGHFYVRNARQMKKIFKQCLDRMGIICTRCEFNLYTYHPTPICSMTKTEIILAEMGLIRPTSAPDWDNIAKTYPDALQGTLLLNDNIINPGKVEKYWSIKPRVRIHIRWQTDFDSNYNRNRTIKSKAYKTITGS